MESGMATFELLTIEVVVTMKTLAPSPADDMLKSYRDHIAPVVLLVGIHANL